MSDEATYTERAKGWIKELEPSADQIRDAYTKMQVMLTKNPEAVNGDTDDCLELLVNAYGCGGGDVDQLLAAECGKPAHGANSKVNEYIELDAGKLYEVSDGPVVELSSSEKRALFLELKERLKLKAA